MTREMAKKILKHAAQRGYNGEPITATMEEIEKLFEQEEPTIAEESEEEKTDRLEKTLKPCPFCGGDAHIMRMGYPHYIYCEDCGAKIHGGKIGDGAEEASVKAWNKRRLPATKIEMPAPTADDFIRTAMKSKELGDYIRKITEQEIEKQRQKEEKKQ